MIENKKEVATESTIEIVANFGKKNKKINKLAPAIKVKDLVIDFGETVAVNKINFEINKGELVTLLGPSGCGKTTTLNAIAGLLTPTSGDIEFSGRNVTKLSPQRRKLGLVFQNYALYPHMSVYKNIAFPLYNDENWKNKLLVSNQRKKFSIELIKLIAQGITEKEKKELEELSEIRFIVKQETQLYLQQLVTKFKKEVKEAKKNVEVVSSHRQGRKSLLNKEILKKIEEINSLKKLKKITTEEHKTKVGELKVYHKKQTYIIDEEVNKEIEVAKDKLAKVTLAAKQKETEDKAAIKEAKNNNSRLPKIAKNNFESKLKEFQTKYGIESVQLSNKQTEEITEIKKTILSFKQAIHKSVMEVSEKVDIVKNLKKKPIKLSGGQQQRVAIARAIVKRPKVLLMDEPLSNLDAKLRISTREWIKNIVRELGMTTVFVTHDQEEAMSISDKVVCMSEGLVQQVGSPMELYSKPKNEFVAKFLGMPEMKIFDAEVVKGEIFIDKTKVSKTKLKNNQKIKVGMRAEHFEEVGRGGLQAKITHLEYLGRELLASVEFENFGSAKVFLKKKDTYKVEDIIRLKLTESNIHLFGSEGERIN